MKAKELLTKVLQGHGKCKQSLDADAEHCQGCPYMDLMLEFNGPSACTTELLKDTNKLRKLVAALDKMLEEANK